MKKYSNSIEPCDRLLQESMFPRKFSWTFHESHQSNTAIDTHQAITSGTSGCYLLKESLIAIDLMKQITVDLQWLEH